MGPTLLSYTGTFAFCFLGCVLLIISVGQFTPDEQIRFIFYCCLGPVASLSWSIAAVDVAAIVAGLIKPRNTFFRLLGSAGIALWFGTGFTFVAVTLV